MSSNNPFQKWIDARKAKVQQMNGASHTGSTTAVLEPPVKSEAELKRAERAAKLEAFRAAHRSPQGVKLHEVPQEYRDFAFDKLGRADKYGRKPVGMNHGEITKILQHRNDPELILFLANVYGVDEEMIEYALDVLVLIRMETKDKIGLGTKYL